MRATPKRHEPMRSLVAGGMPMLMSVIDDARSMPAYPELAGKRVLVTGLTSSCGVDIVRAFAEHKGRLVLQFAEMSKEAETIAEIAAPTALEIKAFGPIGEELEAVTKFAQGPAQALGGLDVVVNLVPLAVPRLPAAATTADIERLVAQRLRVPCLLSKVAANRMALVLTEGLILNVAVLVPPVEGPAQAFASVLKAAMTALTRTQAEEWAGKAVRFNAIAPQTAGLPSQPGLAGEAQVAALALYLASGRGKALSGHVFEAEAAR
jgi:NAD(P)-dependent dehydrogenase (short-subunit alcohol dehydrogenase family)